MTPDELDVRLRTITEHEELYRRGLDPETVNGYRYSLQSDGSFLAPGGFNRGCSVKREHGVYAKSLHSNVMIHRHSRFRTNKIHHQNAMELAYVYSGHARKNVNGSLVELTQGQVIVVDVQTLHNTLPLDEDDILVVMQFDRGAFRSSLIGLLGEDSILSSFIVNSMIKDAAHDGYLIFHSEKSRRLPVFMTELLCEYFDPSPRNEDMITGLLAVIAAELACVHEDDVTRSYEPHSAMVPKFLRYIQSEYRTCTLKDAATAFAMAPDSISRILKREVGSTFNQLVQQQRINIAKRLLAEGSLPVTGVARQVGYENMTHFYRLFQKSAGMSPSAYRKEAMVRESGNDRTA